MTDFDSSLAVSRILETDSMLVPFRGDIAMRIGRYAYVLKTLTGETGSLSSFANGYLYYGFHRTKGGWVFREWLPGADEVFLFGDFNSWDRSSHPLTRLEGGNWEIELSGADALRHGQNVKLLVRRGGDTFERIPAYIRWCGVDPDTSIMHGRIWDGAPFEWHDADFRARPRKKSLLIYEAHIGMACEEPRIGTYDEFTRDVLPRIAKLGYDTVQLMAIQEHPYYASFGYQVSSFFAPSCRYGDPDGLRRLIDTAHSLGISVLLDIVHSHACMNTGEGLNMQDGTDGQYFLSGPRGTHQAWNTRLFDYGRYEVIHFLLSNVKYWLDEFHFDGFRFDGVTSMLYEDHGLGDAFTDLKQYYSLNSNIDAAVYLSLANSLAHEFLPSAVTVAEEMSGMPGTCLPVSGGGLGFGFRLAMGIPDFWIRLIKENGLNRWDMWKMWYELTTSRSGEKSISYAESHDQALVGDKTLIFRLMDAEMYVGMDKGYHSPAVDNAIDMHKLIRFVTMATGKNGYLNFMGNEFGHPEWIDFPREGNGWSYHYARRLWSLSVSPFLKYDWLRCFDEAMISLAVRYGIHEADPAQSLWIGDDNKTLVFLRGDLIFAFNFDTRDSVPDLFIPTRLTGSGAYRAVFSSDEQRFGGQDRIDMQYRYQSVSSDRGDGFTVYLPCRCAVVLKKE